MSDKERNVGTTPITETVQYDDTKIHNYRRNDYRGATTISRTDAPNSPTEDEEKLKLIKRYGH